MEIIEAVNGLRDAYLHVGQGLILVAAAVMVYFANRILLRSLD
jgi:hypothetical protein